MTKALRREKFRNFRRTFIGGSDARIIMGRDEAALLRLWREKRGEIEPEDLSGNLIVQLGLVTEDLNRRWYELNTGEIITDIQRHTKHPALHWMAATLDGRVEDSGAVFEAKFMLPWSFSEEAAAEKYMPQLQHNMWVVNSKTAVLSVITGGGKWVEVKTHADPLYQHLIVTAEKKFWRCVESGEHGRCVGYRIGDRHRVVADRGEGHALRHRGGGAREGGSEPKAHSDERGLSSQVLHARPSLVRFPFSQSR
jgi:predicted phage-related endonuclease